MMHNERSGLRAPTALALALFAPGCALVYDFDEAAGGASASSSSSSAASSTSASASASASASTASAGEGGATASSASASSSGGEPAATSTSTGGLPACGASCVTCQLQSASPIPAATPSLAPSFTALPVVARTDAAGGFVAALNGADVKSGTCPGSPHALWLQGLMPDASDATWPALTLCVGQLGTSAPTPVFVTGVAGTPRGPVAAIQSLGVPIALPGGGVGPAVTTVPFAIVAEAAPSGQGASIRVRGVDAASGTFVEKPARVSHLAALGPGVVALGSFTGARAIVDDVAASGLPPELAQIAGASMAPSGTAFLFHAIAEMGVPRWWAFTAGGQPPVEPLAVTASAPLPIAVFEPGALPVTVTTGPVAANVESPPLAAGDLLVAEIVELDTDPPFGLRLGSLTPPPSGACTRPVLTGVESVPGEGAASLVALFECLELDATSAVVARYDRGAESTWRRGWTRTFASQLAAPGPRARLARIGAHVAVALSTSAPVASTLDGESVAVPVQPGSAGVVAILDASCGRIGLRAHFEGAGLAGLVGSASTGAPLGVVSTTTPDGGLLLHRFQIPAAL